MSRLLVVDDHRVVCSSIRRALQVMYAVDVATSGTEALTLLRANEYALVLCDLMMPGYVGFRADRGAGA
jgi:CheY-like chemotaxis protein